MSTVTPASGPAPLAGVGAAVSRTVFPQTVGESAGQAVQPQPQAGTPGSALDAAVRAAAIRQEGLAPLLADLAAALRSPGLPADLKTAMQRLIGLELPTEPPPTAVALRQAVARSGLFTEARLAAQPGAPIADLKTALAGLQASLAGHADAQPAAHHAEPVPPPPLPDGEQGAQPAVPSSFPPEAGLQAVIGHLQHRVEAARSRLLLQQAASAGGKPSTGPWLFELPLATPQGAAIAQFQIDADESSETEPNTERTWRARFTLDVGGTGPVHAHLALRGEDLMLGLFAESDETAARLDQDRTQLADALQAEALNPQIAIRPGAPKTAPAPVGRFVDSAA
jgi:hypothetical protein